MSEEESKYLDGDVVWVKLGPAWWPGEVVGADNLPPGILNSFKKPPIAVVKFFQEDTFEYVKNPTLIYKYNCSRKNEFIKKGMDNFRGKRHNMEKFPDDVVMAEVRTDGDPDILDRDEFSDTKPKKESYAGLFGTPVLKRTPVGKKGSKGRGRPSLGTPKRTPPPKRLSKGNSSYKAHILLQPTLNNDESPVLSEGTPTSSNILSTPIICSTPSGSGLYSCPQCNFTTTRINVLVMHTKSHSITYTPYTPRPVIKKTSPVKSTKKTASPRVKSTTTSADKQKGKRGRRKGVDDKEAVDAKRKKTDEEIKNSLLADWSESGDDSESPAQSDSEHNKTNVVEPMEVLESDSISKLNNDIEEQLNDNNDSIDETIRDSPDNINKVSCFDFQEDEEFSINASKGIKHVKTDSDKTKSDVDIAKEFTELLEQTSVPDLPESPPLPSLALDNGDKKEKMENFQQREAEGAPPPKVFKTKTFFRSRHSRSQDAIEKYVAEQLKNDPSNANGTETLTPTADSKTPSPEPVKVAKLAPKMQLKKMKSDAQLKERIEEAEKQIDLESSSENKQTAVQPEPIDEAHITNDINTNSGEEKEEAMESKLTPAAVDALLSFSKSNVMQSKISEDPPDDIFAEDTKHGDSNQMSEQNCINKSLMDSKENALTSDVEANNDTKSNDYEQSEFSKADSEPTESDLQIAHTLLNLPSSGVQNTSQVVISSENQVATDKMEDTVISDNTTSETNKSDNLNDAEIEKNKNLKAAESLVQMSVSGMLSSTNTLNSNIELAKVTISDVNKAIDKPVTGTQSKKIILTSSNVTGSPTSKLYQMLDESGPSKQKLKILSSTTITSGKEKLLNLDLASKCDSGKSLILSSPSKQKIIIRRAAPVPLSVLNKSNTDKIILSRSPHTMSKDGSIVPTYSIETKSDLSKIDSNTIIIQKKKPKTPTKPQKVKPQNTIITSTGALLTQQLTPKKTEASFDINTMPIVLSDEILTAESIEKMPIVLSESAVTKQSTVQTISEAQSFIKTKPIEPVKKTMQKILIKPETRTIVNSIIDKTQTPNILSKSNKYKQAPLLSSDKTTKILITKTSETKLEQKNIMQKILPNPGKNEKYILVPSTSTNRTQKIIVNPTTGKAHFILPKITQQKSDCSSNEQGTVMIITNEQGNQSRLVLTPEHEKLLFPKKTQNTIINSPTRQLQVKPRPKIVTKSIITSIPPLTSTTQKFIQRPTISTQQKIVKSAPKPPGKESLIILHQKSGSNIQLTQAQFQYLQKTGQIVEKKPEAKSIIRKSPVLKPKLTPPMPPILPAATSTFISHSVTNISQQQSNVVMSQTPTLIIQPIMEQETQPILQISTSTVKTGPIQQAVSLPEPVGTLKPQQQHGDLDNFEDLLPANAIARPPKPEEHLTNQQLIEATPQTIVSDVPITTGGLEPQIIKSQLLALPGENFGGPPDSFYLCVEENGKFTAIDERPLVLENNELVPMTTPWPPPAPIAAPPRDILAAALANTDVFRSDTVDSAPDFRDLNANVSVNCHVSETCTTLNKPPIMTPLEQPRVHEDIAPPQPSDLESSLAVLGVQSVPNSIDLPITVTDPRIASAPISMPLLDDITPKSMPLLTDPPESITESVVSESMEISEEVIQPTLMSSNGLPILNETTEGES